jgi:hypothetical protein
MGSLFQEGGVEVKRMISQVVRLWNLSRHLSEAFLPLFLFFSGDLTRHETSGVIETWLNQARESRAHFMHHAFLVSFLLKSEESFFHSQA